MSMRDYQTTHQVLELNRIIAMQHHIMLDVLCAYQSSRWPWVRWVANAMHEEMMARAAVAERVLKGGHNAL
jgi:hypothetical protein